MKLSKNTISLILEATKLSNILGVQGLILDKAGIRGYNDDEGVVVSSMKNHGFEFEQLGIARLDSLKNKAALLKDLNSINVEAVIRKNSKDIIEKLTFDCGKINFEFRCALVRTLTDIPQTKMNITPLFQFEITEEDVALISQGSNAMRSKNMTIRGNGSDVQFRFSDDTGDVLNCRVDSELTTNTDIDNVSLTINLKKMLPIFKIAVQDGKFKLNILKNNLIHMSIGNMDVIVMPEV